MIFKFLHIQKVHISHFRTIGKKIPFAGLLPTDYFTIYCGLFFAKSVPDRV